MKILRLTYVLFCFISLITLSAQDNMDSEASSGGLSARFPSSYVDYVESELNNSFLRLFNQELNLYVDIIVSDALFALMFTQPTTSQEVIMSSAVLPKNLDPAIELGKIEELAYGESFSSAHIARLDSDLYGEMYLIGFELSDGTLGSGFLYRVLSTSPIPPEALDEFVTIVETVQFDSSSFVDREIPEGAILVEDMPDDMILTGSGLQMSRLEGFAFRSGLGLGLGYIDDTFYLVNPNKTVSITVYDTGLSEVGGLAEYLAVYIENLPSSAFDNFDPQADFQTVDIEGRRVYYFVITVPTVQSTPVYELRFAVELISGGDRIADIFIIYSGNDLESFVPTIFDFITSIRLVDKTVNPSDIELTDVTCDTIGSDVIDEENLVAMVTCPASCNAMSGIIHGTEIYTSDSSICVAALHMGVVDNTGGEVVVTYVEGQEPYTSTKQNVVISEYADAQESSFSVSTP